MVEDFTHVLPEDKIKLSHKKLFKTQIYDLTEANIKARYFQMLREKMAAIEKECRERHSKGKSPE